MYSVSVSKRKGPAFSNYPCSFETTLPLRRNLTVYAKKYNGTFPAKRIFVLRPYNEFFRSDSIFENCDIAFGEC